MEFNNLLAALQNPKIYPEAPEKIEVIQTHISAIFLAGERVYKIKKPVDFGFLDFTTLEKRKYFCEQEVLLNRRLCPNIYSGVVEIRLKEGQILLGGNQGEIIEYAVLMKKLPVERMMDKLLAQGMVSSALLHKLAKKIALFHKQARTDKEIAAYGETDIIRKNIEENFEQTQKYVGLCLSPKAFQETKENTYHFLEERQNLFKQRIASGMIKDGHGDLHLKHICFADDILIFDCIEFNERFRYGDVAADIAFLLMDLDFHGYPLLAAELASHYLNYTQDWNLWQLLNFYKSYRAYVRGKVTSFRLDEEGISVAEKKAALKEAQQYFSLAHCYAQRLNSPLLLLIGGGIGTGKSTLARTLGNLLGWKVLSSDVIRKELAHIPPQTRRWEDFQQGIYSPDFSEKTYRTLLGRAAEILKTKNSVILDASFKKKIHREESLKLAREVGANFLFIECTSPEEVIKKRLEQRLLNGQEPSDGRWEIFADLQRDFEEVKELNASCHLLLNTTPPLAESLRSIFNFLLQKEGKELEKLCYTLNTK